MRMDIWNENSALFHNQKPGQIYPWNRAEMIHNVVKHPTRHSKERNRYEAKQKFSQNWNSEAKQK